MKAPTKKQRQEQRTFEDQQGIFRMYCIGCPYENMVGSNAMVTAEQRCKRFREAPPQNGT